MAADIQGEVTPSAIGKGLCLSTDSLQSLQLLEYLVKNGSERVVDDARQHLALLRMLRQFHYIDMNGKDQGVNVRNRAQELAKLLGDVESIRAERKKARGNRKKYGGIEGGPAGGLGGGSSSGGRYGGFGSDDLSYGGYQGQVYGDGGGFGGNLTSFQDIQPRSDKFEEYDEETEDRGSSTNRPLPPSSRTRPTPGNRAASLNTIKKDAKIINEPERDLFEFGDEPIIGSAGNGQKIASPAGPVSDLTVLQAAPAGDDEFDDFQSATTPGILTEAQRAGSSSLTSPPSSNPVVASSSRTSHSQPATMTGANSTNTSLLSGMPATAISSTTGISTTNGLTKPAPSSTAATFPQISAASSKPSAASGTGPSGPNYYTSVQSTINNTITTKSSPSTPQQSISGLGSKRASYNNSTTAASLGRSAAQANKAQPSQNGEDAFNTLWSKASSQAGMQNKSSGGSTGKIGTDLASMARKKNEEAMWGPSSSAAPTAQVSASLGVSALPSTPQLSQTQQNQSMGGGSDDLLG